MCMYQLLFGIQLSASYVSAPSPCRQEFAKASQAVVSKKPFTSQLLEAIKIIKDIFSLVFPVKLNGHQFLLAAC